MEVERQFCQLAAEKGIKEAFLSFAAKEAVISRDNRIYSGKAGISEYFEKQSMDNITLTWKPDYVDVADSGDMAWTHGKYTLTVTESEGETKESTGIFHTVWKRQADGSWKYVWD